MHTRVACGVLSLAVTLLLAGPAVAQPPTGTRPGCDLSTRGVIAGIEPSRSVTFSDALSASRDAVRSMLEKFGVPSEARLGIPFNNAYSANPNVRTQQLINQSEDLRQIGL